MNKIAIVGASGHGKVIADIALLNGYDEVAFLDDNPAVKTVGEFQVVGSSADSDEFINKGYDFIVAIGNAAIRERIQKGLMQQGARVVSLIHPSASIAYDAIIGTGSVVMANAVINPGTTVGMGCIINTCASIDHDNYIGDFSHISVGTHTAGTVNIGKRCWLGIGAVVSNNISICDDAFIGAGAVVVKDITEAGVYVGVPARKVR